MRLLKRKYVFLLVYSPRINKYTTTFITVFGINAAYIINFKGSINRFDDFFISSLTIIIINAQNKN